MTPSYVTRLLLLSSAAFFLVQVVMQALIALIAPAAVRRAGTIRPQRAARFLLTLRLLPAACAAIVVAGLCVPSYLRFEPRVGEEEVGFICLTAAVLGAGLCAAAAFRTLHALMRSSRYIRRSGALESQVDGEKVWIVPQSAGLALAGILHPRLLISERALRELSPDQLKVALRHERSHRESRDNLKRLLILLLPLPGLRMLERAWVKCAEWAADDRAAAGEADRSALAEALVRVARLQVGIAMPRLVTSLVEADEDLSLRVDRLLEPAPIDESNLRVGAIALSMAGALIFSMALGSMHTVHRLLELLLD